MVLKLNCNTAQLYSPPHPTPQHRGGPGFNPHHHRKQGMVAQSCNPNIGEIKVGKLEVQGHPVLPGKFEISVG